MAKQANPIRCTFLWVFSVVRWASFQMGNVGRNAEYIQADRHSYLNQHNSGDEWLTGFAGDAMRSIYGSYYGRISALNVWFMATRIIFVHVPSTIQCSPSPVATPALPLIATATFRSLHFWKLLWTRLAERKNSSTGVHALWPWLMFF